MRKCGEEEEGKEWWRGRLLVCVRAGRRRRERNGGGVGERSLTPTFALGLAIADKTYIKHYNFITRTSNTVFPEVRLYLSADIENRTVSRKQKNYHNIIGQSTLSSNTRP